MAEPDDVRAAVADAHWRGWSHVLAYVARLAAGDLQRAEEACQEAFAVALTNWPAKGIPTDPLAWLRQTARRKLIDHVRREDTLRRKLPLLSEPPPTPTYDSTAPDDDAANGRANFDDRLRLIFTCCHPALAPDARVALTLRMVCGLTTAEIAGAFLVADTTMAARLTRAKKKIAAASIRYRVPADHELPERLDAVLTVVHLIFTTGHTAPAGAELVRRDLVATGLELARVLAALMPDEPEALGLLALLEFTDARRATRVDPNGRLILLADQDRSRWDRASIEAGTRLLDRASRRTSEWSHRPGRPPGRFLLQAAIAAAHANAREAKDTDWPAIVAGYDRLLATWPNPVVALNRAVAVSYAVGPDTALADLETLADDPRLARYHYLPATRADFLRRLGRFDEAARAYRAALELATAEPEAAFLRERLREVAALTASEAVEAGWRAGPAG